jgi:hypothetical protein
VICRSFHTAFAIFAENVLRTWTSFVVDADALQNSAAVLTLAVHPHLDLVFSLTPLPLGAGTLPALEQHAEAYPTT